MRGSRLVGLRCIAATIASAALLGGAAATAQAASPASGTITPDAAGTGSVSWTGTVNVGSETLLSDNGAKCFGADNKPAPAASGCDVFALDVATTPAFYETHPGAVSINATGFGAADLDLYVYKRNADGTRGDFVAGDGQILIQDENVGLDKASGSYYAVLTPYTTVGPQSYSAKAELSTRQIAETNEATGMDENKVAATSGGRIAKRARLELEARTGKKVVTGENYLPPRATKKLRPPEDE